MTREQGIISRIFDVDGRWYVEIKVAIGSFQYAVADANISKEYLEQLGIVEGESIYALTENDRIYGISKDNEYVIQYITNENIEEKAFGKQR